jgi:hypothetical protein
MCKIFWNSTRKENACGYVWFVYVYASRNLFTPVGPTSPCFLTNSVIDLFLYAQRCRNRSLGARAK